MASWWQWFTARCSASGMSHSDEPARPDVGDTSGLASTLTRPYHGKWTNGFHYLLVHVSIALVIATLATRLDTHKTERLLADLFIVIGGITLWTLLSKLLA